MDKTQLHHIFSQPFNPRAWADILQQVLGVKTLFASPERIMLPPNDKAHAAWEIGSFSTSDGRLIGLYQVDVLPHVQLERNKASLRTLLRNIYRYDVDGALIVFVQENQWRLSFVSEITTRNPHGELVKNTTEPKRYTYLLGEGGKVRTAVERISLLLKKQITLEDLKEAFSVETLTKEFYRELSDWYFWALDQVEFPNDAEPDRDKRNATSLIRLITRIMFVWFLKEKKLVPNQLFEENEIDKILHFQDTTGSTYYKAILQNLFFATLNTPIGDEKRKFISRQTGVQTFYRYERFFKDQERFLDLTRDIPFLNGGLFENLDQVDLSEGIEIRIDGFSNKRSNETRLKVPDTLFFCAETSADLSEVYDDKKKKQVKVRGLIPILRSYHFTLEENTPLDQEVALDPEMLGKVFENLLAAFNPETQLTARKQTGSFYTPREIVDYMVDECLIAYLKRKLTGDPASYLPFGSQQTSLFGNETQTGQLLLHQVIHEPGFEQDIEPQLRDLFGYTDIQPFDATTTEKLILALDEFTLLDPACGSGAFPMGVLQKVVHVLAKLDPDNRFWRQRQETKARQEIERDLKHAADIRNDNARKAAETELINRLEEIDSVFDPENNDLNYARKLFLIQNCIYGLDIQPIAVQIAKLRFFISLMVDQKINENQPNRGILSLPNLETKFVAADSIQKLDRPKQLSLRNQEVERLEQAVAEVRKNHFSARTSETKAKYRKRDAELRTYLATALIGEGWTDKTARLVAGWNPYDQNASSPFFDPEWMFGRPQGFDIVIGNPPYVQLQKLGEQATRYQKLDYKTFARTGDLYCLFFERGMDLLQPGGVLCYIASNKWMRAGYGKVFRHWLNFKPAKPSIPRPAIRIDQIVDFGDLPVFEATAYPAIVLLKKQKPAPTFHAAEPKQLPDRDLRDHLHFFETNLGLLDNESGWSLAPAEDQQLLHKIRKAGIPLGEYVKGKIYRGVLTGLNEAFVIDETTRARLIAEDSRSAEVIKPFLAGRDIKRYKVNWRETYLILFPSGWTNQNRGKEDAWKYLNTTYPAVAKYLTQFEAAASARYDKGNYWWELRACDYYAAFEEEKIIVPAIVTKAAYAFDRSGFYSNDKTTIISVSDLYLLGIINSEPCDFFMRQMAPSRANGYYEYKPVNLVQLPIPLPHSIIKNLIGYLVNAVLALSESTTTDSRVGVAYLEQVIDTCVYELYFPESVKASGKEVLAHLAGELSEIPAEINTETAQALWRRLYPAEHPVRKAVYYIDTVPEVRRIRERK
ncbi:MAG: TaqI-like C-terminal specificity domain-containing protein [Bacteroidia bacterium]|nr:TaqI-like C-terminal specificity domain-containing protein [Bacteroidia bacterium]